MRRALAVALGVALALPWGAAASPRMDGLRLFVAAALLCWGLVPLAIALAWRLGAIDRPGGRRIHSQPTPRLGGVAILGAVNLALLLHFDFSLELKGVALSALWVALISAIDDVRGVSAAAKLAAQTLGVAILWAFGVRLEFIPDGWWGDAIEMAALFLWVVGVANAFNFFDGLNGLAASLAVAISLAMGVWAGYTQQTYAMLILSALAGGAAGFLPDNARYRSPARVFMGDVGSIYLGWMMAATAVMAAWSDEGAIKAYAAPLLIFSVLIFDMIYTTIARVHRGAVRNLREWIEYVGRDHLHHRLLDFGCSPKEAVGVIVALAWITGAAGVAIVRAPWFSVFLLLAQAVVFYLTLSLLMLRGGRRDGCGGS